MDTEWQSTADQALVSYLLSFNKHFGESGGRNMTLVRPVTKTSTNSILPSLLFADSRLQLCFFYISTAPKWTEVAVGIHLKFMNSTEE